MRGALILLAMTAPMLWSRLLFQIFAKPILNIDATLVSVLLGTDRSGNMVGFLDGSGYMIVLPACSSLANMSLACPGAKSPALGWDRDLIRRYADSDDRVFIVFRGRIYSDQPSFLTVFDALLTRFRREFGFNVQPNPVLAKMNCDAERLPWDQLDFARY
jgi:hypothetical protein